MALKTKDVVVAGLGTVTIKELSFQDYEPIMHLKEQALGIEMLKASIYINGSRAFDNSDLSVSEAVQLFKLMDEVTALNSLGK